MVLGNTGVSALLSSAASTAKQLADLQDTQQSQAWQYGEQDESAYNAYKSYINNRIGQLQSVGTISSAQKAQSLLGTSMTVDRTYRSNQIQNASIGIMEGNYSDEQKADLLRNLTLQAYQDGDAQNGQSLQAMYDRQILSLQAKAQAQATAAAAGEAKAQAAQYRTYTNANKVIGDQLSSIEDTFQNKGASGSYPVYDASGNVTGYAKGASAYAAAKATMYKLQSNVYNAGASDETLSPENQAALAKAGHDLSTNDSFQQIMNPTVQYELTHGGPSVFKITKDPNTGQTKLAFTPVVGQHVVHDEATGKDIVVNDTDTSNASKLTSKNSGKATMEEQGSNVQENYFPDTNKKTGLPDYSGKSGFYYTQQDANGNSHKVDYNPSTGEHVLADDSGVNSFAPGGTNHPGTDAALTHMGYVGDAALAFQQGAENLGYDAYSALSPVAHGAVDVAGKGFNLLKGSASEMAHNMPGVSALESLLHPNHNMGPGGVTHAGLLDGVSHFFSNPVTSVMNFAQGLTTQRQQQAAKFQQMAQVAASQMDAAKAAMATANQANAAKAATPAAKIAVASAPANYSSTPLGRMQTLTTQTVAKDPIAAATQLVTGLGFGKI